MQCIKATDNNRWNCVHSNHCGPTRSWPGLFPKAEHRNVLLYDVTAEGFITVRSWVIRCASRVWFAVTPRHLTCMGVSTEQNSAGGSTVREPWHTARKAMKQWLPQLSLRHFWVIHNTSGLLGSKRCEGSLMVHTRRATIHYSLEFHVRLFKKVFINDASHKWLNNWA